MWHKIVFAKNASGDDPSAYKPCTSTTFLATGVFWAWTIPGMTDAAAKAVSSSANDRRLSISTSDIEKCIHDEDRGSDQIIAGCIHTDISVETLALRREIAAQPSFSRICNRSKMLDSAASFEETS
jgi:hypothetical protein